MSKTPPKLFISCGEASGDLYAAMLLDALRERVPDLKAFGLAGRRSEAAGCELVVDLEEISVIGLFEVLSKVPALKRAMTRLHELAKKQRPAAAVLIDFSGFNLRLAQKLRALRIPTIYYVSPQVWAWRRSRIRAIRRTVDEMLVILPFERAFYEEKGVPVRYVGHPLVDRVHASTDRDTFCRELGLDPARPIVTFLPGSRLREVELHLPVVRASIAALAKAKPELQFLVSRAATVPARSLVDGLGSAIDQVRLLEKRTYDGLTYSEASVVASGTATIEAALCDTPMVVIYRVGALTYFLGKPFVQLPFYSMVNIIAERELVPELLQGDMTSENVVAHVLRLLEAPQAAVMRQGLKDVRERLGEPGASSRAAEVVLSHFTLE